MDIGKKIQAIRNDHEMTQAEFADKFHVSRQTVSNWENNKNYPDLGIKNTILCKKIYMLVRINGADGTSFYYACNH